MSFNNPLPEISITFMSGPLDGKTIVFDQPPTGGQRIITVGRRESCDIHLAFDNQVSRVHARLGIVRPGKDVDPTGTLLNVWLEDSNSSNGTFVERNPDPLTERVELRPGVLFRIGRTWLRLDVPLTFGD